MNDIRLKPFSTASVCSKRRLDSTAGSIGWMGPGNTEAREKLKAKDRKDYVEQSPRLVHKAQRSEMQWREIEMLARKDAYYPEPEMHNCTTIPAKAYQELPATQYEKRPDAKGGRDSSSERVEKGCR